MQLTPGLKVSAAINATTFLVLLGIALFRPHGQAVGIIAGNFVNVMSGFFAVCTAALGLLAIALLYFTKSAPVSQTIAHILFVFPPVAILLMLGRLYR